MIREIVSIDEEKCDGCGLCIPSCHEGALRLVNGKAKLVSEPACDGLGACIGHCPLGAIRVERREADEFDESAVAAQRVPTKEARTAARTASPLGVQCESPTTAQRPVGGCPGSCVTRFGQDAVASGAVQAPNGSDRSPQPSALTHWPVQLQLLPSTAPMLHGARLLVAADCVPVAYADFHADMLRDHTVVIACPKLDDTRGYVEKLAEMIRCNELREIVVAHMEVPCCTGILHAVLEARQRAGSDLPVSDVVVGVRGQIVARRQFPTEATAA